MIGNADDSYVLKVIGVRQASSGSQQTADRQDRPEQGQIEFHG
jgi:hypothetical protein